jgi:hypothetical protein
VTKWIFICAALAGILGLGVLARQAGERLDVAEHNAGVLAKLVAYCKDGCVVWVTEDGTLRAVSAKDAGDQAPAEAPKDPLRRF